MCIVAGCWQEISVPATSSMPASAALSRGRGDAVLAVMVSEGKGRQARLAAARSTRSAGASLPSETVEWVCRSITGPPYCAERAPRAPSVRPAPHGPGPPLACRHVRQWVSERGDG